MTDIRNARYVAGWDAEVDTAPVARTICGTPMMFYRKLDRSVVAMHDACPHRMLPLSMGIREGDSIRCRYHGLKLGPDGIAQEMPLKNDRPNTRICAETFAVAERHRFVWMGEKFTGGRIADPRPVTVFGTGVVFDDGALGPHVKALHRHYHVPASNTAVGHIVLEKLA